MICVRDFCAGYDGRVVLRADALDLREGRVCGLLGRNGSGKSTLLKAVCALGPYQGSVLVDGNEVSDLQRIERARRVAYLPQSLAVPQMSVRTLVSHGRFARMSASKVLGDQDRLRVEEAMRSVGVDGMAGRELPELSGGERQLAYLAMVVAQDAPMLLLDEPGCCASWPPAAAGWLWPRTTWRRPSPPATSWCWLVTARLWQRVRLRSCPPSRTCCAPAWA